MRALMRVDPTSWMPRGLDLENRLYSPEELALMKRQGWVKVISWGWKNDTYVVCIEDLSGENVVRRVQPKAQAEFVVLNLRM